MPMTIASMFWLDNLHDYNINRSISLPFDRYRRSDETRTGRGTSVSCHFGMDLSRDFLSYSLANSTTGQCLALACYYAFLFKLTNGENDLCVGMKTDRRYNEELMLMIGLFSNTVPLRCKLDGHGSFLQLLDHVSEIMANGFKYSYFPFQRILDQHPDTSKTTFLSTFFEFQSTGTENTISRVTLGNGHLCALPLSNTISEDESMPEFDFILRFQHDVTNNQLSYTVSASLDLFCPKTVQKIAQRFHLMLEQVFRSTDDQPNKPIYELSLILPDEKSLMQGINNTQILFPSITCLHHAFAHQMMDYSQKVAAELDDQSLTYAELLHYTQRLSLVLLHEHHIVPGEIVCLCAERSLSMVSAIRKELCASLAYSYSVGHWYHGH